MLVAKRTDAKHKIRGLSPLGPLEVDVLEIVWDKGRVTARDVWETLRVKHPITYTPCRNVLANLVRKGFLAVDGSASAYIFWAALPAERVGGKVLDGLVARLWRGDRGPAVAQLLGLTLGLDELQVAELWRVAEERFGRE